MISFEFDINDATWLSSNQRVHRMEHAARAKWLRQCAMVKGRNARRKARPPVVVVASIKPLTKGRFDPPNAWPTVKPLIDGLVDAKVIPDDDGNTIVATVFKALDEDDSDPVKPRLFKHRRVRLEIISAAEYGLHGENDHVEEMK